MWPDVEHPTDPYPGAVPPVSYVHMDGIARGIRGCAVDGVPLDVWLRGHGAAPLAARLPLLSYGSNRCPAKITWLRQELGFGADPVVVLRACTTGVAAVWAAGLRARDGARPAVLAAAAGVVEEHAVWLATPDQVAVLDRCEGRDERFRLARLHTGSVVVDGGVFDAGLRQLGPTADEPAHTARPHHGPTTDMPAHSVWPAAGDALAPTAPAEASTDGIRPAVAVDVLVERPWVYLGHAEIRHALLVDGAPVRCADVPQDVAMTLSGEVAATDGLAADPVTGAPHPDEWPAALFVYGLLQPGQVSWGRVGAHAAGPAQPTTVPGGVFDTRRGHPAWLPDAPGVTPGVVVPLREPAALLPALDGYEGPEYERIRVVAGGAVCWAYAWRGDRAGLVALPGGWAERAAP